MKQSSTHTAESILCAAKQTGVEVALDVLVALTDAESGQIRYDLRATIDRLGRQAREERRRYDNSHAFHARHRHEMSGYESSGWKDSADGYLERAIDAERAALDLAAVERLLREGPEVRDPVALYERLATKLSERGIIPTVQVLILDVLRDNGVHEYPPERLVDLVDFMVHDEEMRCFDRPTTPYLRGLHATLDVVRQYVGLEAEED